jgi:hypothetical protein
MCDLVLDLCDLVAQDVWLEMVVIACRFSEFLAMMHLLSLTTIFNVFPLRIGKVR